MTQEIVPDTKDWTWTLERPCPDCGFDAGAVTADQVGILVLQAAQPWTEVLERADARDRRTPGVWSDLEYGCHVRDVCVLFAQRTQQMLEEDDPAFANWDQDVTAAESNYAEQDPAAVSTELAEAAAAYARAYGEVTGEQWARTGVRSGGSHFTVLTLAQYGLHDLNHHLHDVGAVGVQTQQ
ncbi:DinB family protein [Luteipulveratus mongoliensis]|uniref:Methyltransferase type 12 n=1 Tax=Luteipulveratus mongoliensis TaxID=571913 RepID=A0A0K1JHQ9_9MICO|nr:DinB family protein [Luteipulveratus mongoliensis]AKU16231.1 methyltransferase type 12 [Luteipulveratus mongoliensis]